jgi:hypothetical protein
MRRRRFRVLIAAALATVLLPAPVIAQAAAPAAGTQGHGFDAAAFADPPNDGRPTVLWFWNGTVTNELIDRQLADLRQRGVHNAVIFPFQTSALKPAFLSDGWFDVVGHALAEAKATGMRVWLFNDDCRGARQGREQRVSRRHEPGRLGLRLPAGGRGVRAAHGVAADPRLRRERRARDQRRSTRRHDHHRH